MGKITGNNNINVDGNHNNVNINHYGAEKIKTIVEDHQHDSDIHLTTDQQFTLSEEIKKIADMMDGIDGINYYQKIFGLLKKKFKVPKYSLIKQSNFNEAVKYIKAQKNIYRRKIRSYNATKFKEITIPLIIIRWKYLGRDDNELILFASEKLCKKITDIKKLSANDIDTLYDRVYYLKK
ncbi:hypothetical protein BN3087_220015 [Sulfurovum sp. enrichment culture clone C5]|uniref:ORF6C domain-containing protein n=1 Tax=Sulfurovum sp. enrichment culture clone C5 TaxID=497650 RepID=A0A0S4XMB7_9BACT|nr:hypothetical protein BN3087_220015 [Sulfurovum sp. enrichment culture clone C5]